MTASPHEEAQEAIGAMLVVADAYELIGEGIPHDQLLDMVDRARTAIRRAIDSEGRGA